MQDRKLHYAKTERLSVLADFVRSFTPRLGPTRETYNTNEVEVSRRVEEAREKALVAAFNEITRICEESNEVGVSEK